MNKIFYSIIKAGNIALEEEINLIIKQGKIPKSKAEDIYKNILVSEFKGISPKTEEGKNRLNSKYKKLLISEICKERGSDCYSYLDKMAPFYRSIS